MNKVVKILIIVLVVLIVLCAALVVWMYSVFKDVYANPTDVFKNSSTVTTEESVKEPQVVQLGDGTVYRESDQIVNILLLGIDSNAERRAKNKGYRSDVMILASLNFDTKEATLISLPRDTKVEGLTKRDYKTGEVTSTTTNKINAAYAFGGGPKHFGAENAMSVTETFLSINGKYDIPIDYYVSIDLDGIFDLCETVGDVEVVLDRNLSGVGKKGQTVVINKRNIDTYLRNRKSGGGDDGRAARQVEYVKACVKKIKEMGAVAAAPSLFQSFIQYGRTNMDLDQFVALASFADGFDMDDLDTYRLEGTSQNDGKYYFIADMDKLEVFLLDHFFEKVE